MAMHHPHPWICVICPYHSREAKESTTVHPEIRKGQKEAEDVQHSALPACWGLPAMQTHLQSNEESRGNSTLLALHHCAVEAHPQGRQLTFNQVPWTCLKHVPMLHAHRSISRHVLCTYKRRIHKYAFYFLRAAPQIPQCIHFIQSQGICQTR